MNIVIIEDERPAAEKLQKAIRKFDPAVEFPAILPSIQSSISWFQQNPAPDLVLMDIELTDGLSLRIFDHCTIPCPTIFITAYDEYWQEAFECNGIDYLLKPVKQEKLENALQKYRKLQQHFNSPPVPGMPLWNAVKPAQGFRKRFLVKRGIDWVAVRTEEIAYAYAAHKLSFLVDQKGQQYILDKSLVDLETELDPAQFFRVSRKWIVNIHHIKRIKTHSKSKLLLELNPPAAEEVIVSQENANAFKQWIDS
jgi:DNA-binding LytR/AlgR family response regulator